MYQSRKQCCSQVFPQSLLQNKTLPGSKWLFEPMNMKLRIRQQRVKGVLLCGGELITDTGRGMNY